MKKQSLFLCMSFNFFFAVVFRKDFINFFEFELFIKVLNTYL